MVVAPLPTENYTILLMSSALALLYFIIALFAFKLDKDELNKCKVVFFQDNIRDSDTLYSVSLTLKDRICMIGTSDLIFRLRGASRDGPLLLYRDLEGTQFDPGTTLNIGLALPFRMGDILEIDLASDNDCSEEGEPILSLSDIYARELPRWSVPGCRRNPANSWKRRASSALFTSLASDLLAFVCLDTITDTSGAGIVGIKKPKHGRNHILRARDVALSLPFTKEDPALKKRAKAGYLALHYIFSLPSKWHDPWSDFSRLDHVFVMFLDQITCLVVVSASFAYHMERTFGVLLIQSLVKPSLPSINFLEITEFDLYMFFGNFSIEWMLRNTMCFIHILWIAVVSSLFIIPLSLVWCRMLVIFLQVLHMIIPLTIGFFTLFLLFRFIGGKEFDQIYNRIFHTSNAPQIQTPSFYEPPTDTYGVMAASNTSLMLRTLECRSVHTGSSVTSTRHLRVEPIICNCLADRITARSLAYVRTKMARLREDDIGGTGTSELKNPKVLHESHTQSTDAPQMPPPSAAPDGSGDVVGVARYCERLVQQASQHIRDKSVIAECFELAREGGAEIGSGWQKSCCPRQCCKRNMRCRDQSFSNATFFTEEDAASVKEMISSFSLRQIPDAPLRSSAEKFRCIYGNKFDLNEKSSNQTHATQRSDLELQNAETMERLTSTISTRRRVDDRLDVSAAPVQEMSKSDIDAAPIPSGRRSKSTQSLQKLSGSATSLKSKQRRGILKSTGSIQSLRQSRSSNNFIKSAKSTQSLRTPSKSQQSLLKQDEPLEQENLTSKTKKSISKSAEFRHQSRSSRQTKFKNCGVGEILDESRKSKSSSNISIRTANAVNGQSCNESDGNIFIGRRSGENMSKEAAVAPTKQLVRSSVDSKNMQSSHRSKHKRKDVKKKDLNKAPFPSGFQDSSSCSMVNINKTYDPEKDLEAVRARHFRNQRKVPFKGVKFKVISFLILVTVQLTELYFVTAFESQTTNRFYELDENRRRPGPGLMHAAVLSCMISLVLYFLFTVHLIAFFSYLIEHAMLWYTSNKRMSRQTFIDQPSYLL